MIETVLIALGLSMDAFAVSVSSGMCTPGLKIRHAVRGAFFFGLFQFSMPIAGWYLGMGFRDYIQGIDHWVAFALLALIGGKMIKESMEPAETTCEDEDPASPEPTPASLAPGAGGRSDVRSMRTLLTLSVATSIDAMAVGLSFSLLDTAIWTPAAIIGLITFAICLTGFEFGKRIGYLFERRAEMVGGAVLIGIGVKILAGHLFG